MKRRTPEEYRQFRGPIEKEVADARGPIDHSVSPSSAYLCPDKHLHKDNYDVYRSDSTDDPDPDDVIRMPSTWRRVKYILLGR